MLKVSFTENKNCKEQYKDVTKVTSTQCKPYNCIYCPPCGAVKYVFATDCDSSISKSGDNLFVIAPSVIKSQDCNKNWVIISPSPSSRYSPGLLTFSCPGIYQVFVNLQFEICFSSNTVAKPTDYRLSPSINLNAESGLTILSKPESEFSLDANIINKSLKYPIYYSFKVKVDKSDCPLSYLLLLDSLKFNIVDEISYTVKSRYSYQINYFGNKCEPYACCATPCGTNISYRGTYRKNTPTDSICSNEIPITLQKLTDISACNAGFKLLGSNSVGNDSDVATIFIYNPGVYIINVSLKLGICGKIEDDVIAYISPLINTSCSNFWVKPPAFIPLDPITLFNGDLECNNCNNDRYCYISYMFSVNIQMFNTKITMTDILTFNSTENLNDKVTINNIKCNYSIDIVKSNQTA